MSQRIEQLRLDILNIDNFNLAEIKSYSDPPPEVYRVMAATFLFIGESLKKVKVMWNIHSTKIYVAFAFA